MDNSENKSTTEAEGESLEGNQPAPNAAGTAATTTTTETTGDDKPKKKKSGGIFERYSVYLLMFVLVVIIAGILAVVSYLNSKQKPSKAIKAQTLSQNDLSQLANSDVTVGDAKQVLNVQSNAVFAGQVLVRSDLQVAGKLQLGGGLSVSSLQVSGAGVFGTVQVNQNLNVQGDTALAGQLTIQKGLNVNGNSTFGSIATSQLTATTIQLSGDLNLTHHIAAGGTNPGRTNGSSLGGGGTASVSGSDTAGSITINTGSGPGPGCMITVNFAQKYNATPHVVVSPVGAGAGGLGYYVNRTTSNFTVCTVSAPPAGQTFGFDYIVIE